VPMKEDCCCYGDKILANVEEVYSSGCVGSTGGAGRPLAGLK